MGSPSLLDRVIGGQAELAHLLLQVLAVHADLLGRLGDVAAVAAERLAEEVALEVLHHAVFGLAEGRRKRGGGRRRLHGPSEEIGRGDLRPRGEQQRLLDGGEQLAHVAPPLVPDAGAQRLAGERLRVAAEARGGLSQEVVDEQRDVLAPLGERRDGELDDAQAIVEVLAEAAGAYGALEVLVGGRDEAYVDPDRQVAAHALELLLLDGAQELRLRLERHVAHLVEEERAAVGRLELPLAPRDGARERALLVAEELALDQLLAERRAVHLDQRLRAPRAPVVERVRHQLLAGAARAADQHGDVGVGDLVDGLEEPAHGRALPDDLLEAERALHLLEEPAVVAAEKHRVHHAADDQPELVVVEGLRHVVDGAELHRLHGDLLRAVGGDHDDRQVRVDAAGVLEHLHAADPVHAEIGDDDVEAPGLDAPERLLTAPRRLDVIAFLAEQALQGQHHRLLVVDDQDATLHGSALRRQRQRHLELGTAARLAHHVDRALVRLDDLLRDRHAETGALLLGGEEGVEDAVELVGRYAAAVVPHADRRGAGAVVEEEVQAAALGDARQLVDGVVDHVHEHAAQLVGVGLHGRPGDVVARHGDLGRVELGAQLGERRVHHRRQVDQREAHVLLLGVLEEVGDAVLDAVELLDRDLGVLDVLTEVGSSPICWTRLLAAAIGLRISCAIDDDSSSMLACFSVCMVTRSRRSSRSTAGSKKRSFKAREPNTAM